MAIREGRWDCQYCGTKGVLGRHKKCPVCATPRPQGTKFYLLENEPELVEGELQEFAQMGPDWVCAFCASSNPASATHCQNCSASREGSSPEQVVKTYGLGETPRTGDMDFAPQPKTPAAKSAAKTPPWLWGVGLLLVLLLCCCALPLVTSFLEQEKLVTAVEQNWERTIAIESYQTVTEEDWQLPDDAVLLSQAQEIQRYEQVITGYRNESRQVAEQVQVGTEEYTCGQRDLGNGFFEDVTCSRPIYETQYRTENVQVPIYRQEPVYGTKYRYEIDKWVLDRVEEAAGRGANPAWPRVVLAQNEREGERTERYWLVFVDEDGGFHEKEFPLAVWQQFREGGEYTAVFETFGDLKEVSP
jgi:hypothetical protein